MDIDGTLEWKPEKLFIKNVLNRANEMKPPNNKSKHLFWFLFQLANWGKMCCGPILSMFSLSTAQTEKNSRKNWGKEDSLFGGLIPWARYLGPFLFYYYYFKYFLGEEEAKTKLSQWIMKENETRYYIGRQFEMAQHLFQFLQIVGTSSRYVITNDKGN